MQTNQIIIYYPARAESAQHKDMYMSQVITLNGDIIKNIRPNINFPSHEKRKDDRERLRFSHCLFLTQDSYGLNYQTTTQNKIVRIIDPVKTNIPYPLAINMEPIHRITSETITLEIPDCTLATLQTHNDANRPKYIKTSDLQTNVVKLGDNKTNLEYFDNMRYYTSRLDQLIYTKIEYDTVENAFKYEWDQDNLLELANIFQPDYASWNPFMHRLSVNAKHKKDTADKILQQISKFGYIYSTKFDEYTYDDRIIEQPIAIFEKTLNDKRVTALILSSHYKIK